MKMEEQKMMKTETLKTIEFVCTANLGRSPIAEAIGQDFLERTGLDCSYQARSSGVMVDPVKNKPYIPSLERMREIVQRRIALDPDFLTAAADLRELPEENLRTLYLQSVDYFIEKEKEYRADFSRKHGLYIRKATRDQTIPSEDTFAVLTMDNRQKDLAERIYSGSGIKMPLIARIGDEDIPDTFGRSGEFYQNVAGIVMDKVPQSIERILGRRT